MEGFPVTPELRRPPAVLGGRPSLSPDVRRFLLSDDGRVAVFDLPTFEGAAWPRDDLLDLVRLLAGRRLDATGGDVPLTDEEAVRLWRRLRERHPELFRGAAP